MGREVKLGWTRQAEEFYEAVVPLQDIVDRLNSGHEEGSDGWLTADDVADAIRDGSLADMDLGDLLPNVETNDAYAGCNDGPHRTLDGVSLL